MWYSFRKVLMTDAVMILGVWRKKLPSGSIRPAHHLYHSILRIVTIVVFRTTSLAAFYVPLNIHGMTLSMWAVSFSAQHKLTSHQSWTVSVLESAMVNWTYLKIIFSDVSIQRDTETQMTLKTTFFAVVCLLRWVFSVLFLFLSVNNWLPDILFYLYLSIIFWGIWRTRIWWRTNSEDAEDIFTKEGYEEYCGKSSPHGRQGYSQGYSIRGDTGMIFSLSNCVMIDNVCLL